MQWRKHMIRRVIIFNERHRIIYIFHTDSFNHVNHFVCPYYIRRCLASGEDIVLLSVRLSHYMYVCVCP